MDFDGTKRKLNGDVAESDVSWLVLDMQVGAQSESLSSRAWAFRSPCLAPCRTVHRPSSPLVVRLCSGVHLDSLATLDKPAVQTTDPSPPQHAERGVCHPLAFGS
uniref:Uncharacterized protein n=1 Tax=Eutreptiella gymnastica TaxID=73025 RepID=A0A7S1IAK6_9EUGL